MTTSNSNLLLWVNSFQANPVWKQLTGHVSAVVGRNLFLLNGRSTGTLELFTLNLDTKKWIKISPSGDQLEQMIGVNMVACGNAIYILGSSENQFLIYLLSTGIYADLASTSFRFFFSNSKKISKDIEIQRIFAFLIDCI